MNKKKKAKFNVLNAGGKRGKKRVKERWRRPRGIDNKKRIREKWAGKSPNIGYKNDAKLRGLHPSGKKEVLIYRPEDLEGLKDVVVRIASSVGKRKRTAILEKAEAMGLRVVNYQLKVVEKKDESKEKGKEVEEVKQ